MVFGKDKVVGTFAPVFSLWSTTQSKEDFGTFASGVVLLDWLKKTGQTAWQMLPLNETQLETGSRIKHVPSPYKGYGIGLDPKFLSISFKKIKPSQKQLRIFLKKHSFWIKDYALFCALRDIFGTDDWRKWDKGIKMCNDKSIGVWEKKLETEIMSYVIQQWQLHESYKILHQKAKLLDILLIGDMPFYLSLNSPLVWKHKSLFDIDEHGEMTHVSGAVTKEYSHFGRQVWGHPLYSWKDKDKTSEFWKKRIEYTSYLYDVIRFDYAAGFFEYAAKSPTDPQKDEERPGPGSDFLDSLIDFAHRKKIRVFAEDSGKHVQILREYMTKRRIPGIRIFRYAYDELRDGINPYYAHYEAYPERSVIYSTTHDTETLLSYLKILHKGQLTKLAEEIGIIYSGDLKEFATKILSKIISSPAKTIIIPIQDWLLSTSRINIPGTEKDTDDSNWQYKLESPIEDLPSQISM